MSAAERLSRAALIAMAVLGLVGAPLLAVLGGPH